MPAATRAASRPSRPATGDEPWRELIRPRSGAEDLLEARRVPIAAVDPNPDQPRRAALQGIEELAASIAEYGLLQPILVTPPLSGRYTVLAGHRRLAAYRHLFQTSDDPRQWTTIPAIERDTDSADRLVVALLENLSRQDLDESEIVTGLRVLHDLRGWQQAEIARRLGVSRAWITQYFRVAGDPVLAQHVQTHQLTVAKAYDVVLASSEQTRRVALSAALEGAPRRIVRQLAKHGAEYSRERQGEAPASEGAGAGAEHTAGWAHGAAPANGVATASPDAAARDLADLAAAQGVTVRLRDLQLAKLLRAAFEAGTDTFDAAAFLRLARADLRRVEALVRTAAAGGAR